MTWCEFSSQYFCILGHKFWPAQVNLCSRLLTVLSFKNWVMTRHLFESSKAILVKPNDMNHIDQPPYDNISSVKNYEFTKVKLELIFIGSDPAQSTSLWRSTNLFVMLINWIRFQFGRNVLLILAQKRVLRLGKLSDDTMELDKWPIK